MANPKEKKRERKTSKSTFDCVCGGIFATNFAILSSSSSLSSSLPLPLPFVVVVEKNEEERGGERNQLQH